MGVTTSASAVRRIGLFGGSFDPVHNAHLALAAAALEQLGLERVELLPASQPWQRDTLGASAEDRLAMLRLATAETPRIVVNPIEIARGGTTYTVETLRALGAGDDPACGYVWLLGADQLANFPTWHDWPEIVRRAGLAVAARPGAALAPPAELADALAAAGSVLQVLDFAPTSISATEIRSRVAAGNPIDGLTPPAVVDYIATHHLYRA